MNCYVGTCSVGPLFLDFNDGTGYLIIFLFLVILGLIYRAVGGPIPDPTEWNLVQKLADRFDRDSD